MSYNYYMSEYTVINSQHPGIKSSLSTNITPFCPSRSTNTFISVSNDKKTQGEPEI